MQKRRRKTTTSQKPTVHPEEVVRGFLRKELEGFYINNTIAPQLWNFWAVEFPPTLREEYKQIFNEDIEIRANHIRASERKSDTLIVPKEGVDATNEVQVWRITLDGWRVEFERNAPPPAVNFHITFSTVIEARIHYYNEENMEIKNMTITEIELKVVGVNMPSGNWQEIRIFTPVAKYNSETKRLVPDKGKVREVARYIETAFHCENSGINLWLWEIAKEIVDSLKEKLQGAEVKLHPTQDVIKIKDIKLLPFPGKGSFSYIENVDYNTKRGIRRNKLSMAYPLEGVTQANEKLDGNIALEISIFEPTKTHLPPTVRLEWIRFYLRKKSEYAFAEVSELERREVEIDEGKLPPPKLMLAGHLLHSIGHSLLRKLERGG